MNFTNFGIAAALFKLGFYKEAAAAAKYDPNVIAQLLQEPNLEPWQLPPEARSRQIMQDVERFQAQLQTNPRPRPVQIPSPPPVNPLGPTVQAPMPSGAKSLQAVSTGVTGRHQLKQVLRRVLPKG